MRERQKYYRPKFNVCKNWHTYLLHIMEGLWHMLVAGLRLNVIMSMKEINAASPLYLLGPHQLYLQMPDDCQHIKWIERWSKTIFWLYSWAMFISHLPIAWGFLLFTITCLKICKKVEQIRKRFQDVIHNMRFLKLTSVTNSFSLTSEVCKNVWYKHWK